MKYQVIIPKSVIKDLDKLPGNAYDKILDVIENLQDNPRPVGCKKLSAREAWRVRMGDYRIIFEIDDQRKTLTLVRIKHRREAYR